MKKITITLGEKEFTITERPRKSNKEYRDWLVNQKLQPLMAEVERAMAANIGSLQTIAIVKALISKIGVSIDDIADAVFSYPTPKPWSGADEDNAYDSQIVEAFAEVLKLAFPFGSLGRVASAMFAQANGPQDG